MKGLLYGEEILSNLKAVYRAGEWSKGQAGSVCPISTWAIDQRLVLTDRLAFGPRLCSLTSLFPAPVAGYLVANWSTSSSKSNFVLIKKKNVTRSNYMLTPWTTEIKDVNLDRPFSGNLIQMNFSFGLCFIRKMTMYLFIHWQITSRFKFQ